MRAPQGWKSIPKDMAEIGGSEIDLRPRNPFSPPTAVTPDFGGFTGYSRDTARPCVCRGSLEAPLVICAPCARRVNRARASLQILIVLPNLRAAAAHLRGD